MLPITAAEQGLQHTKHGVQVSDMHLLMRSPLMAPTGLS